MKRSFGGQMTLTVCLILLTLTILSTITQLMYRHLTVDLLADDVTASASAAADMTELLGTDAVRGRQQLCIQLNYTARATGNDTVVCDESGTVIICWAISLTTRCSTGRPLADPVSGPIWRSAATEKNGWPPSVSHSR